MASAFFQSKWPEETLGLTEVESNKVITKSSKDFNYKSTDEYELKKFYHWEKNYCQKFSKEDWNNFTIEQVSKIEQVAKSIWLCDYLRKGNTLDFPITQAWNPFYEDWETIVGTARLPAIRFFNKTKTINVIRFTTKGYNNIKFDVEFNKLDDIHNYYQHHAYINYRAWNGSLIPGVHFLNRDTYSSQKLQYHNRLVKYCKRNKGLNFNSKKDLKYNLSKILDQI